MSLYLGGLSSFYYVVFTVILPKSSLNALAFVESRKCLLLTVILVDGHIIMIT